MRGKKIGKKATATECMCTGPIGKKEMPSNKRYTLPTNGLTSWEKFATIAVERRRHVGGGEKTEKYKLEKRRSTSKRGGEKKLEPKQH